MAILKKLNEKEDNYEEATAENIALVEYYYGVCIDRHYPLLKRLNQQEHLGKFLKMDADMMAVAVNNGIAKAFRR